MGKTTVSQMFKELGVPIWCADTEVEKLYEKEGEATKKIVSIYPEVVSQKGVDKNKLRNLIHKDNNILGVVEEIVHPLLIGSRETFLILNQEEPFVIFDIPLLLDKNLEKTVDAVLVVTASEKTQRKRVLSRSKITEKDFELIKRNQLGESEKIKKADFVINTDKSLMDTKKDVLELNEKIKDNLS